MNWVLAAGLVAGVITAFGVGFALGSLRQQARLSRIADGAERLASGNLAHRVILPGDDAAAQAAESLNRLADSVQRDRESAAARDAAQRQLLADISHDLRTPITSIAGYTDALQRGLGSQPERYLEVIASKAESLTRLTDDLFYAARIDAGDLELGSESLDLAEAVRRSLLGFEHRLSAADVRVSAHVPETRCPVRGDASALARILTNLVSNSLHHGSGMTSLAVVLDEAGSAYRERVLNDGTPLPDDADRLFRRGVVGPGGGTGLGLAIARELAERMGGAIAAANTGENTVTFTLTMPAAPEFSES